ncbi:MAG: DUF1552 domain-containing protein [Marinagarivorans sp.]|nr:DUF1552 domain-containing protein [Marinagarivorans sp.]
MKDHDFKNGLNKALKNGMPKAQHEYLLDEHHEHAQVAKEQQHMRANAPKVKAQYFKEHEHAIRARGDKIRKDRRRFLELMSKTGISSGMLRAFPAIAGIVASREAFAQGSTKRAVFCYINSGAPNGFWLPKSATQMNQSTEHYAKVASVCNFREIDAMVTGHARASQALGSRNYGQPTMDAIIAPVLSAITPFTAMFVGSETAGAAISSSAQPKTNPHAALNDYFTGGGDKGDPDFTYLKAFEAQQRAIEEIKKKLSASEKERLLEHTAAIQKLESRITKIMEGTGVDPATFAPTLPAPANLMLPAQSGEASLRVRMLEHGKANVDILIAGLKAGLTNFATLQLGSEQGLWKTYGVNHTGGFTGDAHGSVHAGVITADKVPISYIETLRYVSQVPVYFIEQLISNNGPDGKPLIDTTVFAQVTCMGEGQDHTTPNAPFIMATRMPGFKTGFSSKNQSQNNDGSTYDFNETIAKGLGIGGPFKSTNSLDLLA